MHGNMSALAKIEKIVKKEKPDAVLCLGDFTIFEGNIEKILKRISKLGLVLLIHGNHEEPERVAALCRRFGITFLHKEQITIDGWTFLGFGGGGFSERYHELEEKLPEWSAIEWKKSVFLSHAPPYGTTIDNVGDEEDPWHVGSKSLRDICRKFEPRLVLAGHIHERFGEADRIKQTVILNPGPGGMLIDLDDL